MILRVPPTNRITDINYLTQRFLDAVNDASPGGIPTMGTGVPWISGQLGNLIVLNETAASKLYKTTPLHAGEYMYVRTKAASTAAPAIGRMAFWDTYANSGIQNYVVTPDVAVAGAFLAGFYLNVPTKGNYAWIQTAGLANVLNAATLFNATLGNVAFMEIALTGAVGAADFNTLASITIAQASSMFGSAYQLPVAGTVTLVSLF
jgi:hypothetical protein